MNILVIGNGLSAASVCYYAHKIGIKTFRVYNDDSIGGLCEDKWDTDANAYISRFGPHIFHTSDQALWREVNAITPFMTYQNSPKALYRGKYYSLPFNLNTLQQVFGVQTSQEALLRLDQDREFYKSPSNAEEAAKSNIGKTLFEMFQKEYSEKQWKCDVSEIPAEILARVPVRLIYDDNYFNDLYQGIPCGGYTNFIKDLFSCAETEFHLITPDIFNLDDVKEQLEIDEVFLCDRPDKWVKFERQDIIGKVKFFSLSIPYGHTLFEKNRTDWKQDAAIVNHCDSIRPWTRTTDYGLMCWRANGRPGKIYSETPLGEVKSYDYRTIVPYESEARACYPTKSEEYDRVATEAKRQGMILCGRLAENKYLNMDQAMLNAMRKVYNLRQGENNQSCSNL